MASYLRLFPALHYSNILWEFSVKKEEKTTYTDWMKVRVDSRDKMIKFNRVKIQ